ncbi:MAG: hypothetical protein R3A44_43470 [Caldilineaceae bacterium]
MRVYSIGVFLIVMLILSACAMPPLLAPAPWALPAPPPPGTYSGPLFRLSYDYPTSPVAPPDPAPWQSAIGSGEINTTNADAYVLALKDYIADDMKTFLFDYENWDATAAGWYNLPWLSAIRDPIHGTYVGTTSFPPEMFPLSGLQEPMATHVFVYIAAMISVNQRKLLMAAMSTMPQDRTSL